MARQNTQRLRGCRVTKPPQMPPASPLSLHAAGVTVEVEVIVMVLVMVAVAVTVSPVAVVVAVTVAVAAVVSSSVLLQPCKDREAMKPKQMAANARTSCMITVISMASNKCNRRKPLLFGAQTVSRCKQSSVRQIHSKSTLPQGWIRLDKLSNNITWKKYKKYIKEYKSPVVTCSHFSNSASKF